jgi:hypothetical protein
MEQPLRSARKLISGDVLGLILGPEMCYQNQAEACEIFLQNLLQIHPWTRSDGPFAHFCHRLQFHKFTFCGSKYKIFQ